MNFAFRNLIQFCREICVGTILIRLWTWKLEKIDRGSWRFWRTQNENLLKTFLIFLTLTSKWLFIAKKNGHYNLTKVQRDLWKYYRLFSYYPWYDVSDFSFRWFYIIAKRNNNFVAAVVETSTNNNFQLPFCEVNGLQQQFIHCQLTILSCLVRYDVKSKK